MKVDRKAESFVSKQSCLTKRAVTKLWSFDRTKSEKRTCFYVPSVWCWSEHFVFNIAHAIVTDRWRRFFFFVHFTILKTLLVPFWFVGCTIAAVAFSHLQHEAKKFSQRLFHWLRKKNWPKSFLSSSWKKNKMETSLQRFGFSTPCRLLSSTDAVAGRCNQTSWLQYYQTSLSNRHSVSLSWNS